MNKAYLVEGDIKSKLIKFAFPIFLGSLCQQLYNMVDAIVVGNYLGDNALAAVTSTGSLTFLIVGFFTGLFVGSSVVIGNFYGANDNESVKKAVGTTVVFGFITGIVLTVFGYFASPYLLTLMDTPVSVFKDASDYMQTFFLGMIFISLYNTAVGIFQAVGDSKRPLYYLMIASLINIILDIIFVGYTDMGVKGAALATVIAQSVSALLAFYRLYKVKDSYQFRPKNICFDKEIFKRVIKIGFPSAVQNSVISFANALIQTNINGFGDIAMAGVGSYNKMEGFAFIPINAFGIAITSFVSQNIGAKEYDRVKKGATFALMSSCLTAFILGFIIFIFSKPILALFGTSAEAIEIGALKASISATFFVFLAFAQGVAAILRGAGRTKQAMFIMMGIWCFLRVSYVEIVTYFTDEIFYVFIAHPLTWIISCFFFYISYKKLMLDLSHTCKGDVLC